MNPMNRLTLLAADIASRVPAMAQDCTINNATLIEGLIKETLYRMADDYVINSKISASSNPQTPPYLKPPFLP